jgi:uroporphyrinogen decarboxylase
MNDSHELATADAGHGTKPHITLFRAALERHNDGRPPTWLMRQAGRYHGHYRALREQHSFIDLCKCPELACEVTLGPIESFDFDAAILFSDLLFPLEVMGMPLSYEPGPTLGWHLSTPADIRKLESHPNPRKLAFQGEALRLIRERLPESKGLIGFVGGPLTLFFYAAEGSHQGALRNAREGLTDGRYRSFCEKLIPLLAGNMAQQWRAGIDCIAVLDTCAGELDTRQFGEHVVPLLRDLLTEFRRQCPEARVVYYSKGTTAEHWRRLRELTGSAAIQGLGIDWRSPIADALREFGDGWAIQGNFDPHALLLPEADFLQAMRAFLAPVRALPASLRRGWICGLGHGVLPSTPESHVRLFVDLQREAFS